MCGNRDLVTEGTTKWTRMMAGNGWNNGARRKLKRKGKEGGMWRDVGWNGVRLTDHRSALVVKIEGGCREGESKEGDMEEAMGNGREIDGGAYR